MIPGSLALKFMLLLVKIKSDDIVEKISMLLFKVKDFLLFWGGYIV